MCEDLFSFCVSMDYRLRFRLKLHFLQTGHSPSLQRRANLLGMILPQFVQQSPLGSLTLLATHQSESLENRLSSNSSDVGEIGAFFCLSFCSVLAQKHESPEEPSQEFHKALKPFSPPKQWVDAWRGTEWKGFAEQEKSEVPNVNGVICGEFCDVSSYLLFFGEIWAELNTAHLAIAGWDRGGGDVCAGGDDGVWLGIVAQVGAAMESRVKFVVGVVRRRASKVTAEVTEQRQNTLLRLNSTNPPQTRCNSHRCLGGAWRIVARNRKFGVEQKAAVVATRQLAIVGEIATVIAKFDQHIVVFWICADDVTFYHDLCGEKNEPAAKLTATCQMEGQHGF